MNIALKALSIALLCMGGAVNAIAADPGLRQDVRNDAHSMQLEQAMQQQRERARMESQIRSSMNDRGASEEEPRRSGRMSPEERRALRQQINEAGRDLYSSHR